MDDRRLDLSRYRRVQVEESFQAAKYCFEKKLYRDSLNRSYYAAFYAVKAIWVLKYARLKTPVAKLPIRCYNGFISRGGSAYWKHREVRLLALDTPENMTLEDALKRIDQLEAANAALKGAGRINREVKNSIIRKAWDGFQGTAGIKSAIEMGRAAGQTDDFIRDYLMNKFGITYEYAQNCLDAEWEEDTIFA